jgi:hypothetical protein
LTDTEGSKVFIKKIISITLENNKLQDKKFDVEKLTFPEDIINKEDVDGKNFKEYRIEILE